MSIASSELADLIGILPGYDPWEQAGDCRFDESIARHHVEFVEKCCTFTQGARAACCQRKDCTLRMPSSERLDDRSVTPCDRSSLSGPGGCFSISASILPSRRSVSRTIRPTARRIGSALLSRYRLDHIPAQPVGPPRATSARTRQKPGSPPAGEQARAVCNAIERVREPQAAAPRLPPSPHRPTRSYWPGPGYSRLCQLLGVTSEVASRSSASRSQTSLGTRPGWPFLVHHSRCSLRRRTAR